MALARRGALIVLEGGDRAGKSTQVEMVVEALNALGRSAQLLKFPDRTTSSGKVINDYLANAKNVDDRAVHLLFAANRRELESEMRTLLKNGVDLVVDRYAFSGVAYSAAKGLDLKWCMWPDVGLPEPDLVVYLDVAPEVAAQRGGYGAERYETAALQARVRTIFKSDLHDPAYWSVVDAGQSIDTVHQRIMQTALDRAVARAEAGTPLASLWRHL
ncbi:thymidylate kinase [Blastocladiella britannica]|nr:thymidylate kinase [Blastocladiella britannica]